VNVEAKRRLKLESLDPQYTIIQMVMLPGNKAIFTVPVLAFLQSDDELAHAISYEIAHVLLEHRREHDSRSRLWIPVAWTFLTGNVWAFLGGLPIMLALNSWVYWDLERVHEIEADRLGMKLAVRAGYEPKGAVNFWRRLRGEMGTGRLIACSLVS
jgi:predicted Zn-dependent protease